MSPVSVRAYVGRSGEPGGKACRLRDVQPSWGGDARLREASDVRVSVSTLSGMRVSRLSSNLELSALWPCQDRGTGSGSAGSGSKGKEAGRAIAMETMWLAYR